jgi:hypothetical protein
MEVKTMKKTQVGKIGRLPKEIREQLNHRLENGEIGKELIRWLNSLPEVQKILADLFGGRAIREQNLSEWRKRGYVNWLHSRDAFLELQQRMEAIRTLGGTGGKNDVDVNHYLGKILVIELADAIERLQQIKDPAKRWQLLRKLSLEFSRLRMDKCREQRLDLKGRKTTKISGLFPTIPAKSKL